MVTDWNPPMRSRGKAGTPDLSPEASISPGLGEAEAEEEKELTRKVYLRDLPVPRGSFQS